jgi:DNA-binding transcriptional MocR family regulator
VSFKFTALALDHGPSDALEKLLLLALCDRADENGVSFPSRADLCKRAACSAASVSRKLRVLEVCGWIQRKQRFNSSSIFRVNVQRLERLEAAAVASKRAVIPAGFRPFEDEIANPQAIEIKGDAHCEHGDAHCEHGDAHCEPTNLPLNQSLNKKDFDFDFQKVKRNSVDRLASNSGSVVSRDGSGLSAFQRSRLWSGQSLLVGGVTLQAGTAEHRRLTDLLRIKGGVL